MMYITIFNYDTSTTEIFLYTEISGSDDVDFDLDTWVKNTYGATTVDYFVSDYLNIEI